MRVHLAVLLLFFGACVSAPAASSTTTPATTRSPAVTTTTPATSAPASTSTTAPPVTTTSNPALIEIEIVGTTITGGGKRSVPFGDEVTIMVTADVVDEAHLHGYDIHADIRPGVPAVILFDATIPGVFELELEGSGLLLAEIEVS